MTELDELIASLETALRDPSCPARVPLLIDVRRSTSLAGRKPREIRLAVRRVLEVGHDRLGPMAMLATPGVRYGMARMASAYGEVEGYAVRALLSEQAALEWLVA